MINVTAAPACLELIQVLNILPQQLNQAVNGRQHGLVTDGLDRVICLYWLDSQHGILTDSRVVQVTRDLHGVRINAVEVQVAIRISTTLPGGRLTEASSVYDTLHAVSKSFGPKLTCHPACEPRYLYAGPWDGKSIRVVSSHGGGGCLMLGTFYSKSESCELVWAFDVEKYLAWYANNLAPTISAENAKLLNPRALIQAQINVLEDLFGAEWFNHAHRSARPHPAFERWLLCQDFLRRGGRVHIPLDTDRILAFLDVMIDNSSLVEVTGGDWARSLLGDLANYGDAAVSRRLRSIIGNGDQFLDTLLEISTAAWHSSKGHWVEATEDPGRPDIRIVIPEWDYPVLADCKRVSRRANDRRFKKLVEKVSRQVRNAGQAAYGIGYFDISSRVSPLYTGDARPPEVVQVEELVQRQMRLHHRCVSAVVLLWKQHRVLPLTGGPVGVACYLLQRSTIVRHERPHYRLPFETSPVLKASTAAVKVFAE